MNFVADESVDRQIVEAVCRLGHEVVAIAEVSAGISDEQVLRRATESQSVLLTADKDFGELVYRHKHAHTGIVLLRLAGVTPEAKAALVASAVEAHAGELNGSLCVITEKRVRISRARS